MDIKTTSDLCNYIAEHHPCEVEGETSPMDAAVWFCCIQDGIAACELNLKDLAGMFKEGFTGYNEDPEAKVQEWLDSYQSYCDMCAEEDEEFEPLVEVLEKFYNPPK